MQLNFGDILLDTLALFVWAALIWMFIPYSATSFAGGTCPGSRRRAGSS